MHLTPMSPTIRANTIPVARQAHRAFRDAQAKGVTQDATRLTNPVRPKAPAQRRVEIAPLPSPGPRQAQVSIEPNPSPVGGVGIAPLPSPGPQSLNAFRAAQARGAYSGA